MDSRRATSCSLLLCFIFFYTGIRLSLSKENSDTELTRSAVNEIDSTPGFTTLPTIFSTGSSRGGVENSEENLSRRLKRESGESDGPEDDENVEGAPPDHVVPFSEHENPEEPSTKPKYTNPGDWAKPPTRKDLPLEFVPTKIYAQVRGTHTVKRVPREEALRSAETPEEILSAPRLREVVSKSKKNTVYTEEGYEDAAYDHAGHVRDADFHEGFARKLDDERKAKIETPRGRKLEVEEDEDEEEDSEEELDYDDDYRDHVEEASKLEEVKKLTKKEHKLERKKGNRQKSKENNSGKNKTELGRQVLVKELYKNPEIDPKKVTENEIEKLEKDLKDAYAESEKNVEDEVPRNLQNSGSEDDEEDDAEESKNESRREPAYGDRTERYKDVESGEASMEAFKNLSNESSGSEEKKRKNDENALREQQAASGQPAFARSTSTTTLQSTDFNGEQETPTPVASIFHQTPPSGFSTLSTDSSSTTPDYGRVFWNYFKLANENQNHTTIGMELPTIVTQPVNTEEFTSPAFTSVHSTLKDFDSFGLSSPSTELADFLFATSSIGPVYPRATRVYETWKRRDAQVESEESELEDSRVTGNSEEKFFGSPAATELQTDPSTIVTPFEEDGSTTSAAPRKLSYKVIVRSNEKSAPTSTSPTRDRQSVSNPVEFRDAFLPFSTQPGGLDHFGQQGETINERNVFDVEAQDLQPPLPIPLRQVTYADFLPDSYPKSPVRQTVTQEIGQRGKKGNGARDQYNGVENSAYDKRYTSAPHFHQRHRHGHRETGGGGARRSAVPSANLVPPSPAVRSSYADFSGVQSSNNADFSGSEGVERKLHADFLGSMRENLRNIDFLGPKKEKSLDTDFLGHKREKSVNTDFLGLQKMERPLNSDYPAFHRIEKPANTDFLSPKRGKSVSADFSLAKRMENPSDYLSVKRIERPRLNRATLLDPWPELVRLYRSLDRTLFGRRRRRSLSRLQRTEEISGRSNDEREMRSRGAQQRRSPIAKVDRVDGPERKDLRPRRNFVDEGANRLVALGATRRNNDRLEKPRGTRSSGLSHEELLEEAPRIAEEEIGKEIEARFKDEEDEDEENEHEEQKNDEDDEIDENEDRYENQEQGEEEDPPRNKEIDVEVPEIDVSDLFNLEEYKKPIRIVQAVKTNKLDPVKYPFYGNSRVPQSSTLKYITNPRQVPRKTFGGTEFYDSRDRYLECEEVEPDLDGVAPEEEEPKSDQEPRGYQPRLQGLGDKLDCFRAKYFDEEPLDNPLFLERRIEQPRPPQEFNPREFASRIFSIPAADRREPRIVRRISKKPEVEEVVTNDKKRNRQVVRSRENSENSLKKEEEGNIKKDERKYNEIRENGRRRRPERRRPGRILEEERREVGYPVVPYQKQVYEDVMGTIKNLAGMYEAFGQPQSRPPWEVQNVEHRVVVDPEEQRLRITERPRTLLIHGLLPPLTTAASEIQPVQRYRVFPYRTNKVTYRTRARMESPLGTDGARVGYFKTVRVHKRSLEEIGGAQKAEKITGDSMNTHKSNNLRLSTVLKLKRPRHLRKRSLEESDMEAEESRTVALAPKNSTLAPFSKTKRRTRTDRATEPKPSSSQRVVYTIRDRIRYSKPRGEFGKNGKFSNLVAAGSEDVRRREPRYNGIERKELAQKLSTEDSTGRDNVKGEAEDAVSTATSLRPINNGKDRTSGRQDFLHEPGEIYKIQFSTVRGTQAAPIAERRRDGRPSRHPEEDYHEENPRKNSKSEEKPRNNNYDVREEVEEDVTTVASLNLEPTKAPEYFQLEEYLSSDPPGYSEAFTKFPSSESSTEYREDGEKPEEEELEDEEVEDEEESEAAKPHRSSSSSSSRGEPEDEEKSREEEQKEELDENNEQLERPSESYAEEESSTRSDEAEEDPDSRVTTYKSSEDEEDEEKNANEERDGEKEFDRFASRPYSPFESYEDPKYAELGPRISKPSFHHPSFEKPSLRDKKEKKEEYSGEESEERSDESKRKKKKATRYVFPWEEDEAEDVEESKNSGVSLEGYEYPWERRARLARERKKKEKARREFEKLFGYSNDDEEDEEEEEEQDASNTDFLQRRVYPWEYYDVPSKKYLAESARRIGDNLEVGTEYRPVTRFSSRYKARKFRFGDEDDDPIDIAAADPSEIRVSVLEGVKKGTETSSVDPVRVLKSIVEGNLSSEVTTTTMRTIATPASVSSGSSQTSGSAGVKRRARKWRTNSTSTSTPATLTSTESSGLVRRAGRGRTMRIATSTTKKPVRMRKRIVKRKEEVKVEEKKGEMGNKTVGSVVGGSTTSRPSTVALTGGRKVRRRGNRLFNSTTTTTTTMRPRRRLQKSIGEADEKSVVEERDELKKIDKSESREFDKSESKEFDKSESKEFDTSESKEFDKSESKEFDKPYVSKEPESSKPVTKTTKKIENATTERSTTPKTKTVEHRSSFKKEEIITKTSYPGFNEKESEHEGEEEDEDSSERDDEEGRRDSKKSNTKMNESVKKVSIVTKETPEHIYRAEEVDKDGVKGMFVSITPNNGTKSSEDRKEIDKEMIERFEDFEDEKEDEEPGGSFGQDRHLLMANLLRQVHPFMNDLMVDHEKFGDNYLEGSGDEDSLQEEEELQDEMELKKITTRPFFEKEPNNRVYYYVEK